MFKFSVSLIVAIFLTVCGCATIYNPATEQKEFIFITTPVEVSLGNMLASKISRQFKISNNAEGINRVKEIGERIAHVSDRQDLKYHFTVIEDNTLNAFASPGGYVYINSGLIKRANDDELACVIGHEVGHVAARHVAKKLQAQIGYDILMNIAVRKGGLRELQKAASISYNLIMLGYSREDEFLADRLGMKYAYKAGYDPHAMITFLKKLKESKTEEMGFIFLRSHPYSSQRIKMAEAEIPSIIEKVDKRLNTSAISKDQHHPGLNLPVESNKNKKRPLRVMCPVCKRIFPGRIKYCPYDGTKLQ